MSTAPTADAQATARVLVVDDEPGVVSFVARALRGRGFDVDVAAGGEAALAMTAARRYDVVLLDLRMPGTNGVVVLKQLMQTRPDQKVVVVSAVADTRIKGRCLELGASDFRGQAVRARGARRPRGGQARRPGAPGSSEDERVLRAGRLELHLDRRTVDAGAWPVALPAASSCCCAT